MEDATSRDYDVSNTSGLDDVGAGAGAETPDSPLWIVLMDRSQLVMTIIGLIANIATSLTLIKNGQVSGDQLQLKMPSRWPFNSSGRSTI